MIYSDQWEKYFHMDLYTPSAEALAVSVDIIMVLGMARKSAPSYNIITLTTIEAWIHDSTRPGFSISYFNTCIYKSTIKANFAVCV